MSKRLADPLALGRLAPEVLRLGDGLPRIIEPNPTCASQVDFLHRVAEEAKTAPGVKPVWDHLETWLKAQGGRVKPRVLNTPRLVGVQGNPGLSVGEPSSRS